MFKKYLKYRRACLFSLIGVTAASCVVTPLYCGSIEPPVYVFLLSLVGLAGWMAFDFPRFRRRMDEIEALISSPEALSQMSREGWGVLEGRLAELAFTLDEKRRRSLQDAEKSRTVMADYFTAWTHQIKTPIAAMSLLLQQEEGPLSRSLREQLFKTEQYVDMVMAYARLDSPMSDFVIRKVKVDAVVRRAVKKYAPIFIGKSVRVSPEETGLTAVSDEKWLGFAIEQVISNAVKYTPSGGVVSIYAEGSRLVIEDTGVGIRAEDLPRVFERGYTGGNGRGDENSSGIGLYLTRLILGRLGHGIEIDSTPGKGTRVKIDLTAGRPVVE